MTRDDAKGYLLNMFDSIGTTAVEHWTQADADKMRNAVEALEVMPTVDVQPVRHGHWMLCEDQNQDDVNNGNYLYVCSNCNHSDIHAKTVEVPFCWHCGALMDEVAQ